MALGSALAIGALAVGSQVLGDKAANKAAGKAADTSLAVAEKNNQLARDIYGQNQATLSPFVNRGNVAGDSINALLGLPSVQQQPQAQQTAQPAVRPLSSFGGVDDYYRYILQQQQNPQGTVTTPTPAATPAVTPITAKSAFDNYLGSTGYQFRVNEGQNALNSGFAGKGLLDSGASRQASQAFGQNIASDEFGRYLGYLSNQQGVGLSGGSALAGVGQNYVNNVSANNNSAGTAAANAALIKGQNTQNLFGGIAGGLGSLLGSSYGFGR